VGLSYCDRGGERAHLENIKRPGVEKGDFFRGNRYGGIMLREVCDKRSVLYDIYESSYRIMGDNLGGGKAGEPLIGIYMEILKRAKQ
jgi:hypothetical protein